MAMRHGENFIHSKNGQNLMLVMAAAFNNLRWDEIVCKYSKYIEEIREYLWHVIILAISVQFYNVNEMCEYLIRMQRLSMMIKFWIFAKFDQPQIFLLFRLSWASGKRTCFPGRFGAVGKNISAFPFSDLRGSCFPEKWPAEKRFFPFPAGPWKTA